MKVVAKSGGAAAFRLVERLVDDGGGSVWRRTVLRRTGRGCRQSAAARTREKGGSAIPRDGHLGEDVRAPAGSVCTTTTLAATSSAEDAAVAVAAFPEYSCFFGEPESAAAKRTSTLLAASAYCLQPPVLLGVWRKECCRNWCRRSSQKPQLAAAAPAADDFLRERRELIASGLQSARLRGAITR